MYINVNDVAEVKLAEEKKNVNYSESTLLSLLLFLLYHRGIEKREKVVRQRVFVLRKANNITHHSNDELMLSG
jgi:hypothetical protein